MYEGGGGKAIVVNGGEQRWAVRNYLFLLYVLYVCFCLLFCLLCFCVYCILGTSECVSFYVPADSFYTHTVCPRYSLSVKRINEILRRRPRDSPDKVRSPPSPPHAMQRSVLWVGNQSYECISSLGSFCSRTYIIYCLYTYVQHYLRALGCVSGGAAAFERPAV